MGAHITETELLSCFANLLQDAEAEVRAAAAKNLAGYITIVKADLFASEVLPLLSTLSQDTAPNVRSESRLLSFLRCFMTLRVSLCPAVVF